ncbi:MAG: hypothetical protein PHD02_00955 [Bacilli bacterium]|nr:hypothetical protein [Bacilli bacterium]
MKIIKLEFEKTLTRLAGNPFGVKVFSEQVESNIDWNELNKIIFPEQINRIAISFIQGFAKEILKRIDKNDIEKVFDFEVSSEELKEKIISSIKF